MTKEKELRIALVCFGGVSLAIYMHGISKEVLKLVRASRALHSIADREERARASFSDSGALRDTDLDTEDVYFELLRDIGRTLELRVIVDIVAGASAGGINATMLARALSHDLPMGALRDLWLDQADISTLLDPEARAGTTSKLLLKAVVWLLGASGKWPVLANPEVRSNLSLLVRSRWFKPPLSGPRMAELMYNAVTAMGRPKEAAASLVPTGQRLDLFVTVTDHHGYQQPLRIHDPAIIHEREHRHVLRFRYQRRPSGEVVSDFGPENAAALAFAARATSSFPGVFPPAQIGEIDDLVAREEAGWTGRADFIARNFQNYTRLNLDPTTACFLDGSVLNNRPFREAMSAIHGRPAYRQVDRRVVYIEPDPTSPASPARRDVPGFFTTLKSALTDLPRAEPITDELNWAERHNAHVGRLRDIIEAARPRVRQMVAETATMSADEPIAAAQVRAWREQVNVRIAREAGFAYQGYVRLKLASVRSFLSNLIVRLRGAQPHSPFTHAVEEIVGAWMAASGTLYDNDGGEAADRGLSRSIEMPPWASFLLAFDLEYGRRRLHFLIEGQNRLYPLFDEPHCKGHDRKVIDRMKRSLYDRLDELNSRERIDRFTNETADLVARLFPAAPAMGDIEDLKLYAARFVADNRTELDRLVERLATEIDLDSSSDGLDGLAASADPAEWHPEARRELLTNYLGFPYWDVLTFPLTTWRESGEFNEILIDRISPHDAKTLASFRGSASLKGTGFGHFAAFFSRAFRENDYLLGRIHALDRLIDIVCNCARVDMVRDGERILGLKKRGFARIVDAEERHLSHSAELIAALRRAIADLK